MCVCVSVCVQSKSVLNSWSHQSFCKSPALIPIGEALISVLTLVPLSFSLSLSLSLSLPPFPYLSFSHSLPLSLALSLSLYVCMCVCVHACSRTDPPGVHAVPERHQHAVCGGAHGGRCRGALEPSQAHRPAGAPAGGGQARTVSPPLSADWHRSHSSLQKLLDLGWIWPESLRL